MYDTITRVMPPFSSSFEIISPRKFVKISGIGGADLEKEIENLKLQHVEELRRASDAQARRVEELEHELAQCREEIAALNAMSDERSDKFMPLPTPSRSLKFVTNTTVRKPKGDKNTAKLIASMKNQHKKELATAKEQYAKKLKGMRKELDKYKAEAILLRASSVRENRRLRKGVGANDKENASKQKAAPGQSNQSSTPLKSERKHDHQIKTRASPSSVGDIIERVDGLDDSDLREKYDRLFQDDYEVGTDLTIETALVLGDDAGGSNEDIVIFCNDMFTFMKEVRSNKTKATAALESQKDYDSR